MSKKKCTKKERGMKEVEEGDESVSKKRSFI